MSLRVLFVTAEFDDFVQVGGLGAVSGALPRALHQATDVRVFLPGYRDVLSRLDRVDVVGRCPARADLPPCEIARVTTHDGLPVYVVLCDALFNRPGNPYADEHGNDWPDNDVRFARFASAAASLAAGEVDPNWQADLVHANDWQAALVPAFLAWNSRRIPSILTIHNLAYQGLFPKQTLSRIGAPDSAFHIEGIEFYDKVSFLKAGLVYASHLTTVSETYAHEIVTPKFGCGLEGLLARRSRANELTGIVNGIDDTWNSQTCPELYQSFRTGEWKGKRANTEQLRREFGLALSRGPLFGLVARLVHQKGVDLVLDAAETIVAAGGQLVVMGRGEAHFEQALQDMQRRRPQSVAVAFRFENGEARRIFAATDFTLMPSRFEPCGLSQMYAQRFGSLPIGHNTGGLADTIIDGITGFLFDEPSPASFLGAICRAFGTFGRKGRLNLMRGQAMAQPFAWTKSAAAYRQLYGKVLA